MQSVSVSCRDEGTLVALSATNTDTSGSFKCVFPDGHVPAEVSAVTVNATDSDGETGNTATRNVTVVNGTIDDPGVNDTFTGTVNWGDGSPTQNITVTGTGSATYATPSHAYATAGSYTITVRVTDKDGDVGIREIPITVLANAPFTNGVFITSSAWQFQNDLSPWQVADFEILKRKDSTIVATNPGQFYEHVRVVNFTETSQPVTMTAKSPYNSANLLNSFVTHGGTPVHCYQQLAGSTAWSEVSCAITINASTGTATASVASVPAGATVWMTVHLDYAGKGRADALMTPRSFNFTAGWSVGPFTGGDSKVVIGRPKKVTMV